MNLTATPRSSAWSRFAAGAVRFFHAYAGWLVGISWWRFGVFSILLVIACGLVQELPPFRWVISEEFESAGAKLPPTPPVPPKSPKPEVSIGQRGIHIEPGSGKDGVEISIDKNGIRVVPRKPAEAAASAPPAASAAPAAQAGDATPASPASAGTLASPASEAAAAALAASQAAARVAEAARVQITLPPGATSEAVREAVDEARKAIEEAVQQAEEEARDAAEAAREAAQDAAEAAQAGSAARKRVRVVRAGDFLINLAMLWILGSGVIKVTYKRQIQAEAQAAQAVETAEAESLKRQVVEARMAAMQAQVEPHFLFNTLASIDHLIEVDPQRASQMQKNLIALLRASMPTMREANDGGERDLGRELAVIRPYLEILKVRMEERLATTIDVPDGLLSAEFPSMMIQTLVENAIKHGLEPKPEGGQLAVKAEIVHGKLAVTVADTGLGFGKAATAGTGVGLANIRERLALRYGGKASLVIAENAGGGTRATITVPYRTLAEGATA